MGQGTKRQMVMNTGQRRQKLDTALRGCKQTRREYKLYPASRSHGSLGLGAVYSETGTHGSEEGRAQRCADLFHCADLLLFKIIVAL